MFRCGVASAITILPRIRSVADYGPSLAVCTLRRAVLKNIAIGAILGISIGCATYRAEELAQNVRACEAAGRSRSYCMDAMGISASDIAGARTPPQPPKSSTAQTPPTKRRGENARAVVRILTTGSPCCRKCSSGKPCGDSCIASGKTCHKPRGCAC